MVATRRSGGRAQTAESTSESQWSAKFNPQTVDNVYEKDLLSSGFNRNKIIALEFSQYLEKYLWKNYKAANKPSKAFAMSIIVMINEKYRERISAWNCIEAQPDEFCAFFRQVLELSLDPSVPMIEQTFIITFIGHCVNSLEVDVVRREALKFSSISVWKCLGKKMRESLLKNSTKMRKYYNKLEKAEASMPKAEADNLDFYSRLIWRLCQKFNATLEDLDSEEAESDAYQIAYVEKFILLLIDLEAQLTTRRFLHAIIEGSQVIIHSITSQFYLSEAGTLFFKLVNLLVFYARFEVDNLTGYAQNLSDISQNHYDFVNKIQVAAFRYLNGKSEETKRDFCLLNIGNVDTREHLAKEFNKWNVEELYQIAYEMSLVPEKDSPNSPKYLDDADFLRELLIYHAQRPVSQLDKINAQPLYPNESVIWDENLVPYEEYDGVSVLPLNKLNLQFLTLHDYLQRNFHLFQMESTYEIRHDLEDVMFRCRPWKHELKTEVVWGGWARMALPVTSTRIVSVGKPFVGQSCPSEVKCDVAVHLPKRGDLRNEWQQLRRNDVLFLLHVVATEPVGTKFDVRRPFKEQFKIAAARGCEVEGILGKDNTVIEESDTMQSELRQLTGDQRTFRVRLDPNQYQLDTENTEIYFSFNLVVRRDPKANNFKAVLSTIRQLLNTKCVVPDWIHDVLLGYGEPDAASYTKMPNPIPTLDFNDTFLDFEHLRASFPDTEIKCDVSNPSPPFRLTFNALRAQHGAETVDKSIVVEPQPINKVQKLLGIVPKRNNVRFTPSQVEAIKSGMEPGLTMVVGPPGTGKTDLAVQIISNIYHNWPEERTLIVTHSNQALNQLFEKIIALDVDERHLLRLGHGEEALETSKDFSRYGRVNYVLQERLNLLKKVSKLKKVLKEVGDVDYSCETAGYFYRYTVCRNYEDFVHRYETALADTDKPIRADFVKKEFPFNEFFDDFEQLFKGEDITVDYEKATACWAYIQQIFQKLSEFHAFELLRNGRERSDYLLVREAKIIAMTCTHAALRRKDLVELGFQYDNVVMEESAQILEVETFIPLLLQEPAGGINRLKRWIMIGDHHQLPPVVQNVAYQKYSNMEQSLFTRFIRLGVPHVQLDAQGRARAEIAALYNWRYVALGDLPHVAARDEFQRANPGFAFNYQFIDVGDFHGVGESTPSAYFYQNLGEAEYTVALYTYMRILGYPASRISILTTYNGQRSLLLDVLQKRCESNPLIGMPAIVSTVDKYQGQQNDFVILSLVRTRLVGHLRDVRRLIVAMSRARLGLYVLGRKELFEKCLELAPVFEKFAQRPSKLLLYPAETYDTIRKINTEPPKNAQRVEIENTEHMANFVYQFYTSNLDFLQFKHEQEISERKARSELEAAEAAAAAAKEVAENTEEREAAERNAAAAIAAGAEEPMEIIPAGSGAVPHTDPAPAEPSGIMTAGEAAIAAARATVTARTENAPKEHHEDGIEFEEVDYEHVQQKPNYK